MAKKIMLPKYEQMILDIGQMETDELENIIRCAKAMLSQKKPKTPRKSKPKPIQEKAS